MSTEAIQSLAYSDSDLSQWFNGNSNSTTTTGISYYWTHPYWPAPIITYATTYVVPDKTKAAFALAKKLVKSKWMTPKTIGEFIELVELIETEL